jgi:hypothetical protein
VTVLPGITGASRHLRSARATLLALSISRPSRATVVRCATTPVGCHAVAMSRHARLGQCARGPHAWCKQAAPVLCRAPRGALCHWAAAGFSSKAFECFLFFVLFKLLQNSKMLKFALKSEKYEINFFD